MRRQDARERRYRQGGSQTRLEPKSRFLKGREFTPGEPERRYTMLSIVVAVALVSLAAVSARQLAYARNRK